MDTPTDKRKQPCDEATLRRLADMRIKANEVRKKKAELRRVEAEERKAEFDKKYKEKVLKDKTEPRVEETEKPIYPEPAAPPPTEDDETESEEENEPLPPVLPPTPAEPNYKQMYYKAKLDAMQQQADQKQFVQNYQSMPYAYQAADIARQNLKNKANKQVLDQVYQSLFGGL